MTPSVDDSPIFAAEHARTTALEELSALVRHELATIVHIARSTTESCVRGDLVTGHKRLVGLQERCERALAALAAYTTRRAADDACSIAEAEHLIRVVARGLGVSIELARELEDVRVRLPRPALSFALTESAAALAGGSASRIRVSLQARTNDRAVIALTRIDGGGEAPAAWRLEWIRSALARHGGALGEADARAIRLELPTDAGPPPPASGPGCAP